MVQIELLCGHEPIQFIRVVVPVTAQEANMAVSIDGIPAQTDIVSRRHDGSPDSIEVIASGINKNPGGLANYDVRFVNNNAQLPDGRFNQLPNFSAQLIDNNDRVYQWHSVSSKTVQKGAYKKVMEHAGVLQSPEGIRMFGVVLYTTQYINQEEFEADIDINNGLVEYVIGNVFVKSLYISFDNGYNLYPKLGSNRYCDQKNNDQYFIMKPGEYFWPKQGHIHRRFVASNAFNRKSVVYKQNFGGLAFCLDWNEGFGVSKTGIGTVTSDIKYWGLDGKAYYGRDAYRRQGLDIANALNGCLETGQNRPNFYVYTTAFGPFHPYYYDQQGSPGGYGIIHYAGYRMCVEDFAANVCIYAMNCERQPVVMYHQNGRPKTAEDFLQEGHGIIPFNFAPLDYQGNNVPAFRDVGDFNTGTAPRNVSNWAPHDSAHQCRYSKPMQALAFLGNDWLAKRDMEMLAEIDYLYLNEYPQNYAGGTHGNLKGMLEIARLIPGQGGLFKRNQCWPIEAILAYYAIASPEWRNKRQSWIHGMAQTLTINAMPTAWCNRNPYDMHGQVVETAALPAPYDIAQTFEIEFEDWIKRCLWINMQPGDRLRTKLMQLNIQSAKSLFTSNVWNGNAYLWFIAVGINHGEAFTPEQLQYHLTSGNNEIFQGWYVLNHAYLAAKELNLTDVDWLSKSLSYRETATSKTDKIKQLYHLASEEWNNHITQALGLIWSLQNS